MDTINSEVREELAIITDTLDNLTHAARLPMPPAFHLEQLLNSIKGVRDDIRKIIKYDELI